MPTPIPPNAVVYDVETKHTFAEVNNQIAKLEISFLGLYSYSQNQYFSFFEKDLRKLELILLKERPTLIGFNSIHFDNVTLQPYCTQLQINDLPQIDILVDIQAVLGFRLKLESVAQATLGEGKSGSGLDAIRYWREGDLASLSKYCLDDVRITRDIYNFGCAHGFILYTTGGELRRIPMAWSTTPTITDQLHEAYTKHQRVEIDYLSITDVGRNVVTTRIDILVLTDKTMEVFCHFKNTTCTYQIERVLALRLLEEKFAFQASLF